MKISEPIAIVGIGGVFPKALTVREFWKNILERVDCIEDITTRDYLNYWRVGDYLDPEPLINNKTYARKAGFLPEIEFDAMRFGIPPKSLEALSTAQLYALYVADQTLADARLSIEETTPEQRARTSVILGVGGMGNTGVQIAQRATVPDWARVLRQLELPEEAVQAIIGELTALYADWQESTFPGFLSNIVAGRIASRFDLGGSNFTVDAACAATLAAVKVSIGELLDGSSDAVLTGGVNVENSIVSFLAFSRIGALSRREECHPFGVKADGLVLGDCCGMFVLKRLSDAERDGDRIYALIRGIGSSSDGRAKSIYAPRFEGQVWAVERAYADSGISPGEISYVEAHGTGTPVGDPVEIQSLSAVFDRCAISRRSIALSSVKSQIGHTRIAAGAASIIKVALALQHKVLPPMTHADSPIPQLEDSAFYLNPTSRPWIRRGKSTRKAALSALGFGGTNFHVLMEEYDGKNKPYRLGPAPISLFFHAPTREALIQEARRLYAEVTPAEGENVIRAYVADINRQQTPPDHPRLACVGPDLTAVRDSLSNAIEYLSSRANVDEWKGPRGTYFRARSLELAGKTVALFPGQGAQHPNMGLELALNFPEFQEVLSLFDRERERQGLSAISDLVYPVSVSSQEQIALQRAALTATVDAQPALGAVSWGMYLLLSQAGLKSDFALGHSYGELPALCCGGAFGQQDLIRLSVARGRLMSQRHASGVGDAGKMLAVKAPSSEVVRILGEAGHKGLYVTNQNSTKQTVVGGSSELVDQFQRELQSCGIASIPIAVSGAFHTPYFEAARTEFQEEIGKTAFQQLRLPVLSNVTGQPFVESSSTNQSLLGQQMVMPVLFRQCIERVFDEGGRLFVEIGPGSILSDFVRDILAGREYFSVALHPKIGVPADLQYWNALAKLKVLGLPVSIVDPNFLPSRAPRVVSGKSLKFTLDGGLYLCPETRRTRERALNEPKELPQLSTNSLGVHVQAPNGDLATPTGPKPAVLPHITVSSMPTTPTRELSHLHGKFIECQSEFVRLVASTLDAYTAAAQRSNGHNSPDLAFTSYQETLAMLDKAQTAFHQTHREYLNHRNEIERLIDPNPPARRADLKDPAPVMTVRQQIRADWGGNGDPSTAAQTTRIELSAAHHTAPVQPETRLSSESVRKLDRETIATKLVQVVSETTGFPNESINLAMDLESDLGIDSIMKIEILAGVREAFPEIKLDQLDTSMQIRTLDEIVEALSSLVQQPQEGIVAPTAPTSFNKRTPEASPVEQSAPLDLEQLKQAILEVLVESGYPKEMIGLDMDLEADLGLDSIRKLEILAKIQQFLTIPDVSYTAVTNLRTINQILQFAKNLQPAAAPATVQVPASGITRFRVTLKRAPAIERVSQSIPGKWAIFCQEPDDPLAEQISHQLTKEGRTAIRLSAGELNGELDHAEQIGGIIILASKPTVLTAPIDGFRDADYSFLKAVFALAGNWKKPEGGSFISTSRLGGTLGLSHEDSLSFVPAGLSGLTKSLGHEWPGISCRHIDLDDGMPESDAASAVLEEAFDADSSLTEVGRTRRGQRWRIDLQAEPISDVVTLETEDSKDELLLVTGGGRGITAECIVQLCSRFAGRVVLLGRTALDTEEPAWANGEQTSEELYKRALASLAQGHPNPTPIQAKRLVGELISRRETLKTLDRIRGNGVECAYCAVDVTDSRGMAEVLHKVQQQYGPVTSIVHGAGNLADKRIEQKVDKDLASVVDTKVKGLEHLLRHVDLTKLRRMLLFSSVSSVFGNAGQTDYALANEVLNKFALSFSLLHPKIKTVAICWGPWDLGMMNETLKRLYAARQIELISQTIGPDFFIREFFARNTEAGQVVICGQIPVAIGGANYS